MQSRREIASGRGNVSTDLSTGSVDKETGGDRHPTPLLGSSRPWLRKADELTLEGTWHSR